MSVANSIDKRHILALLITIAFYNIPTMLLSKILSTVIPIKFDGIENWLYWPIHALLSAAYFLVMYNFARIRMIIYILSIEIAAILFTIPACIQWALASESQWFYDYFEHIMALCCILQIVAIMVGAAHGGVFHLFLFVRKYSNDDLH